jgi:hypothetical protein
MGFELDGAFSEVFWPCLLFMGHMLHVPTVVPTSVHYVRSFSLSQLFHEKHHSTTPHLSC